MNVLGGTLGELSQLPQAFRLTPLSAFQPLTFNQTLGGGGQGSCQCPVGWSLRCTTLFFSDLQNRLFPLASDTRDNSLVHSVSALW